MFVHKRTTDERTVRTVYTHAAGDRRSRAYTRRYIAKILFFIIITTAYMCVCV